MILGDLHKRPGRFAFLLLLLASSLLSRGQGYIDLLSVEFFEGLNKRNYDRFSVFNTTLQAPVPLPSKDVILAGFVLEGADIRNESVEYSPRNITFNAGLQKQLPNGKSILAMTFNRFNSDEHRLSGDSYQLGFRQLVYLQNNRKGLFSNWILCQS